MNYYSGTLRYIFTSCWLASAALLFPKITHAAPPDCHISQGLPEIDYGHLTPTSGIASQTSLTMSERAVTVTVNCLKPKRVALLFDGEGLNGKAFRFGESGKVGVTLSSATVDGRSVGLSRWNKGARSEDRLAILAGDSIVWQDGAQVASGTLFTVVIGVEPTVSTQALHARDITVLESRIRMRLETY